MSILLEKITTHQIKAQALRFFQNMGFIGFFRMAFRLILLLCTIYFGLVIFMLVRLFEWPFGRKITPYITQIVCYLSLLIIGLKRETSGEPFKGRGAVVANHPSMLDIFVLNATQRIFFVAKHEIRSWFGIGILAVATGTLFIERNRGQSLFQKGIFYQRLSQGDTLLFFPEGTTTNGLEVVPFKSTLFAAFFENQLYEELSIQPVSVYYKAPKNKVDSFYAWWQDDVFFAEHLTKILSAPRGGVVKTVYCPPIKVADYNDRKALALACEKAVKEEFLKSQQSLQNVS